MKIRQNSQKMHKFTKIKFLKIHENNFTNIGPAFTSANHDIYDFEIMFCTKFDIGSICSTATKTTT